MRCTTPRRRGLRRKFVKSGFLWMTFLCFFFRVGFLVTKIWERERDSQGSRDPAIQVREFHLFFSCELVVNLSLPMSKRSETKF